MTVDDRQLEGLAKDLGAAAGDRLDVNRTARAVMSRLKAEPERVVWWRRQMPVFQAVAAAAMVVLAIGLLSESGPRSGEAELHMAYAPLALEAFSEDELTEVYDSLSFEAPIYELTAAGLDDMSVGQLEELLETMMED